MSSPSPLDEAAHYWRTAIIRIRPGEIAIRGYPIEELIGRISFASMIWLMLRGDLPGEAQARLLEAALVASVDHGPQAPSIAIARMAASCGLPLNSAVASALNALGDSHGGAAQWSLELYGNILAHAGAGARLDAAAAQKIDEWIASRGKYLPGFGHRFHPVDPRAGRLLALVDEAISAGVVPGQVAAAARAIEAELLRRKGKLIPMNIGGATAVIYGELGFSPPLARGIFCLSRAVGFLAHASEQAGRDERNKGPVPRTFEFRYEGPAERHFPGRIL